MTANSISDMKNQWQAAYPGGAPGYRRMAYSSAACMLCFFALGFVALFSGGFFQSMVTGQAGNHHVWLAFAVLGGELVAVGMGGLLGEIHQRRRLRIIKQWVSESGHSVELLSRLAISPEIDSTERKAISALLDAQSPEWRVRAMQTPAPGGIPRLPHRWKSINGQGSARVTTLWAAFLLGLATISGWGWWKSGEVWMAGVGAACVMAWLYLMGRREIENKRALHAKIMNKMSEADLILLEAFGQLSRDKDIQLEGVVARGVLNLHYPGWSLSAHRPLWQATCPNSCG